MKLLLLSLLFCFSANAGILSTGGGSSKELSIGNTSSSFNIDRSDYTVSIFARTGLNLFTTFRYASGTVYDVTAIAGGVTIVGLYCNCSNPASTDTEAALSFGNVAYDFAGFSGAGLGFANNFGIGNEGELITMNPAAQIAASGSCGSGVLLNVDVKATSGHEYINLFSKAGDPMCTMYIKED